MTQKRQMNAVTEWLHVHYNGMFKDGAVIKNICYGAISWIPTHLLFHKIYYPLLYKQFTTKLSNGYKAPKVSIKTSGRSTMHFFSTIHALYICYTSAKSFKKNKYQHRDIVNAPDFNFPDDIRHSVNVSLAYWILDIIPTLLVGANDIQIIAHHLVAMSWCSMLKGIDLGGPGHIHIFYWAELSTIFLNISWFLRDIIGVFDQFLKHNNIDNINMINNPLLSKMRQRMTKYGNISGFLFAIVFLYSRLYKHLAYSPRVAYNIWTYKDEKRVPKLWKRWACFIVVLFQLVNIIWSNAAIKKLIKFMRQATMNKKILTA